jgi:hypothetical protein
MRVTEYVTETASSTDAIFKNQYSKNKLEFKQIKQQVVKSKKVIDKNIGIR